MKPIRISVVKLTACLALASFAEAAPVHFWLSPSANSSAPEAPVIDAPIGQPIKLYLWTSLGSDINGLRSLQDLSLDIVTQVLDTQAQPPSYSPESDPIVD